MVHRFMALGSQLHIFEVELQLWAGGHRGHRGRRNVNPSEFRCGNPQNPDGDDVACQSLYWGRWFGTWLIYFP